MLYKKCKLTKFTSTSLPGHTKITKTTVKMYTLFLRFHIPTLPSSSASTVHDTPLFLFLIIRRSFLQTFLSPEQTDEAKSHGRQPLTGPRELESNLHDSLMSCHKISTVPAEEHVFYIHKFDHATESKKHTSG